MIDYKITYNTFYNDIQIQSDTIITIEEDIDIEDQFERDEMIRDILLEKLTDEIENKMVEILDFEELTNGDCDIYQLTY